jgi:hypothetical protein
MVGSVFVVLHGAIGVVNGLGRIHKFNFNTISDSWFKVIVKKAMSPMQVSCTYMKPTI